MKLENFGYPHFHFEALTLLLGIRGWQGVGGGGVGEVWADIHGIRKYLCGIGVLVDSGRGKSDATGILWKEKAAIATGGDSFTPRSGGRLGGATRGCWDDELDAG